MQQGSDPVRDVCGSIRDALNQIGDFSYAILPKSIAHACADFDKAVLTELKGCLQWQIDWIDNRLAGGDRLREEWREKCRQRTATEPGTGSVA